MAPSILIVGSTGNTGAAVVRALPALISKSSTLSNHRILACTRNGNGSVAQDLAKISGVEVVEVNWTEIDADWLREHQVERVYSACHNEITQFFDESTLYNAIREADVKYAVRLSTTYESVSADNIIPYGRAHWAIEAMLSDPSFSTLHWTSLQPEVFIQYVVPPAIEWYKNYQQNGEKGVIETQNGEAKKVYPIDSHEVGIIAAHLLALDDTSPHNQKRYVLSGPQAITGRQMVDVVEKHAGTKVDKVKFNSVSVLDRLESPGYPKGFIKGLKQAITIRYTDQGNAPKPKPTSPEILKLYAPKNSALDFLDSTLNSIKSERAQRGQAL